jgi:hypothetical protein
MSVMIIKEGTNPPRIRRAQRRVREDVMPHEYGFRIQVRKEGQFQLPDRVPKTMEDGYDGYEQVGETTFIGPETFYFSPSLGDMTIDDFPDGFSFGNGASGAVVQLSRIVAGEVVTWQEWLSWFVFPFGVEPTADQQYKLREISEGIPPGNTEKNTWKRFNVNGGLMADDADTLLSELLAKPTLNEREQQWLLELPALAADTDVLFNGIAAPE